MELQDIRKYLDQFDTALRYILLQRMAIIPLVAEIKLKNNIPMFQPKREEEIFNALKEFSLDTGLKPELLTDMYKIIIKDAHRIENNIIDGNITLNASVPEDNLLTALDKINDSLKEYIKLIDITKAEASNSNEELINIFTGYYRGKISNQD
ncbi:MAG: chorismate mutase [Deltaproteobacteria bacterium]